MTVRFINPDTLAEPPTYTHVVEVAGPGRMVFLSGQLGLDRAGNFVGAPGDFRAQAVQVFENMKAALAAVGADFGDVVKITNYLVDLAHLPILREVRAQYFSGPTPPASTLVQISALARPGALLEIEAVAALPPAPKRTTTRRAPAAGRRRGGPAPKVRVARKKRR